MAGITDIVILAVVAVGGYLVFKTCIIDDACFGTGPGDGTPADCVADPTAVGCEKDTGNTSGGSQCGDLCRAKDCSGYKKSCTTGCVYCCGSGKNAPSCSGGGSSGGVNCKDGNSCQTRCTKGWCTSLKACCSGFKCDKCSGSGGGSSGGGCTCKSGLKVARQSPCTCTTCGQLFCGKTCNGASDCPTCSGNNHRVCTGGRCGCAGGGSNTGGGTSGSGCTGPCKQNNKCQTYPAGSANCCSWRGRNGGCPSGKIGVPAGGTGCKCITGSSYTQTHAYYAPMISRTFRVT